MLKTVVNLASTFCSSSRGVKRKSKKHGSTPAASKSTKFSSLGAARDPDSDDFDGSDASLESDDSD